MHSRARINSAAFITLACVQVTAQLLNHGTNPLGSMVILSLQSPRQGSITLYVVSNKRLSKYNDAWRTAAGTCIL